MELSERATRLLGFIDAARAALIEHTGADAEVAAALEAISRLFAAGMSGLSEEQLARAPVADEWSMAEVAEHVAEHDSRYIELEHHGIGHYVEHGLEHALQL